MILAGRLKKSFYSFNACPQTQESSAQHVDSLSVVCIHSAFDRHLLQHSSSTFCKHINHPNTGQPHKFSALIVCTSCRHHFARTDKRSMSARRVAAGPEAHIVPPAALVQQGFSAPPPDAAAAEEAAKPHAAEQITDDAITTAGKNYKGAPFPLDEQDRCNALCRLGVLDTTPEPRFDDITKLVCALAQKTCLCIHYGHGMCQDHGPCLNTTASVATIPGHSHNAHAQDSVSARRQSWQQLAQQDLGPALPAGCYHVCVQRSFTSSAYWLLVHLWCTGSKSLPQNLRDRQHNEQKAGRLMALAFVAAALQHLQGSNCHCLPPRQGTPVVQVGCWPWGGHPDRAAHSFLCLDLPAGAS